MKCPFFIVFILLFTVMNAHAVERVTCVTDKVEYYHGETVLIKITNNSNNNVLIPDREYIDGRFARPASEIKLKQGKIWKTMKMVMTSDEIQMKTLRHNESHIYTLRLLTLDESRGETILTPGVYARPNTYKVFFHTEYNLFPVKCESNEFAIKSNITAK